MSSLENSSLYVSVDELDYESCIDVIEHTETIDEAKANIRIHHLKFDGNGRPMSKALAELLYQYIIDYCIASKNRPDTLTNRQSAQLTKEARKLFRHPETSDDDPDKTGEAGETLLFFLTEAILKAPQIVAKMELKTNRRLESNGSDGIHMRWCEEDQLVDFYFGESKLYSSIDGAITSALKSINEFHDKEIYKHEFTMITKHFKYADDNTKNAVVDLIKLGEPGPGARINHACLIGYNWKEYKNIHKIKQCDLSSQFREMLLTESKNISKALNTKFKSFEKKHLNFEVFFLPFPSVQQFRDEFNAALD